VPSVAAIEFMFVSKASDNDIVDEYDNMTQQGNQRQHAPFQNYVV
jgi:hypothetical protein